MRGMIHSLAVIFCMSSCPTYGDVNGPIENPFRNGGGQAHQLRYSHLNSVGPRWAESVRPEGLTTVCTSLSEAVLGAARAIRVSNKIKRGDAKKLQTLVEQIENSSINSAAADCPKAVVLFDSPGGNLVEAIEIGRQLSRRGYPAIVEANASCKSACAIALFGASAWPVSRVLVFTNSEIGIHRPLMSLTDNETQAIRNLPNRDDYVFRLAGDQWSELSRYLVDEIRNRELLLQIVNSPYGADKFSYIDTFEEAYLLGINILSPLNGVETDDSFSRDVPQAASELGFNPDLNGFLAHHVCSLLLAKNGAVEDLDRVYLSTLRGDYIVGYPETWRFCYVEKDDWFDWDHGAFHAYRACVFGADIVFRDSADESFPFYLTRFAPRIHPNAFTREAFERYSVPLGSHEENMTEVHEYLTDLNDCAISEIFFAEELHYFEKSMVVLPACQTSTKLCKSSRHISEFLEVYSDGEGLPPGHLTKKLE